MSERPTPETDALVPQFLNGGEVPDIFAHCRKLERERDEASEQLRMVNIEANARNEIANALKERDEALEESLEQARLLGISGERECRLIAERNEAKAIAKEAITGLYTLGDYDLANRLTSKLEETK